MPMTDVLFSPVGLSDPVRDYFDGPFLHILRHYRPRRAYIVLTRVTADMEYMDHRYTEYARRVSPETELELLPTGIEDASDFELYFPIYEKLLDEIAAAHAGERVLVNMSSGTPQGIATLCARLCSRAPGNLLGIQVKTPEAAPNVDKEHFDGKETIDEVLESLMDEHPDLYRSIFGGDAPPCRCVELKLRNYTRSYLVSRLDACIRRGDYEHCAALAEDGREFLSDAFVHAAKGAILRQRYRIDEARECFSLAGLGTLIPRSRCSKALEFYLGLRHAFRQGDYAAFYARISPLALAMAREALEKGFGLPMKNYIAKRQGAGGMAKEMLDFSRLRREMPEIAEEAEKCLGFPQSDRDEFVKLIILNALMEAASGRSSEPTQMALTKEFKWVREQEDALRNFIAHNMGSLAEAEILSCSNVRNPSEVIERMDKLFIKVYQLDPTMGFEPSLLNQYQKMNKALLGLLESSER